MSIGSDKARVWARELPLGKCSAKAVMLALANYVDENGHCFPSAATLARDTDQTEGNVRRLLKWLEDIGVIVRLKRWRVDNGVTVVTTYESGAGRQTSDEIRLCIKVDHETVRARIAALEGSKPAEPQPSDDDEICLRKIDRQNSDAEMADEVCPGPGAEAIAYAPEPTLEESSLREESSPQSPPSSEAGNELDRFKRTYPIPSNRPQAVADTWAAMSGEERRRAIKGAEGVKAVRAKEPKRPVVDPAKFLKDPALWDEFARFAPPALSVGPAPARGWIAAGTCEFEAYKLCCLVAGFEPELRKPAPGMAGYEIVGSVPAGAQAMAELGWIDRREWRIAPKGSAECIAWCDRVREWTGRRPEITRFWLDEQDNIVPSVREAFTPRPRFPGDRQLPRSKDGLLVPPTDTGFPPPKGVGPTAVEAAE